MHYWKNKARLVRVMMLSDSVLFPIGMTVAVQLEDGALWSHGTVVDRGDHDCNDTSYNIYDQDWMAEQQAENQEQQVCKDNAHHS